MEVSTQNSIKILKTNILQCERRFSGKFTLLIRIFLLNLEGSDVRAGDVPASLSKIFLGKND